MAKRDLDKEFKEHLNAPKSFPSSDENWKAAAAMLDKELPVAAGGRLFNRTTVLLSVAVLFLFSLTFVLPISSNETNANGMQNSTESISNSSENPNTPTVNENRVAYADSSAIENETNLNSEDELLNSNAVATSNTAKPTEEQTTPVTENFVADNEAALKNNAPVKTVTPVAAASAIAKAEKPNEIRKPVKTNAPIAVVSDEGLTQKETVETQQDVATGSEGNSTTVETTPQFKKEGEEIADNNGKAVNQENASPKPNEVSEQNSTAQEITEQDESPTAEVSAVATSEDKTAKPSSAPHASYFKIGFESGIFATNRTLKTSATACEDYVTKRNNEESMKPSYYFGLNFGQQLNKLNWQVGLNYATYQEQINYSSEISAPSLLNTSYWNLFNTTDTTVSGKWVIDSIFAGHWSYDTTYMNTVDSNYVEQWDTTIVTKQDSTLQQNNGVHSLSYFEIPLFVGYTFGKDKWFLDVQPGVSVGFLSGSRGSRYIDKNLRGLVEPSASLEQFNKVIWKAHLRVGVRYVFEKWDLGLYPHYSYTLNNVLNSTKVDQRYGNFGVSIGAYYRF